MHRASPTTWRWSPCSPPPRDDEARARAAALLGRPSASPALSLRLRARRTRPWTIGGFMRSERSCRSPLRAGLCPGRVDSRAVPPQQSRGSGSTTAAEARRATRRAARGTGDDASLQPPVVWCSGLIDYTRWRAVGDRSPSPPDLAPHVPHSGRISFSKREPGRHLGDPAARRSPALHHAALTRRANGCHRPPPLGEHAERSPNG